MILKNPTTETVSISFRGIAYSIPAGESLNVPVEAGTYWKERIHTFLEVEAEVIADVKTKEPKEPKEIKETAAEKKARLAKEEKEAEEAKEAAALEKAKLEEDKKN